MEFFAIADVQTTPDALRALTVAKLATYCSDIDKVLAVHSDDKGSVYCVWGEFSVERQTINGGIRFTLPSCPNALSWTITTGFPPSPHKVVIHCTINRTAHEEDFVESIESFIEAWKAGLENHLTNE
jgi:hypothetical protein